ncbi:hypothetical protein [Pseudomarimonas arenosa]|uniref:MucB/RseB N-terminal domain-containing protein n=1 Tax=Pseudomarimonas arenosa TaxID=2774145 RepID=A0AAW3ZR76_9GAMM|nr:hypothetical protein [Pseudomarimonas arenosa]MBD8527607.1 hypothetical protein [Pseudomarimonas arenosa]
MAARECGNKAMGLMCQLLVGALWLASSVSAGAEDSAPAPAVRATYEWRAGDQVQRFDLLRARDQVERRVEGSPVRRWRREADGIGLIEIDVRARRVVEFSPGELRARRAEPQWSQLAELVDPALRQLPERKLWRHGEHQRQRFAGKLDDQREVDLIWLRALRLPEKVEWRGMAGRETLRLLSVEIADGELGFTPCDGCLRIDAADLGEGPHTEPGAAQNHAVSAALHVH